MKLSNNYSLAEQRVRILGNRVIRDPETHKKHKEKTAPVIADGHAVENNEDSECASKPDYFVPHHFTRPSAKFRVVFDCAARYADTTLNDKLLQGPNLVHCLLGMLYRFCHYKFAFSAVVSAMFYQVRFHSNNRNTVQFLWWVDGNPHKAVVKYKMCVHTFGLISSSFVTTIMIMVLVCRIERLLPH